MDFNFVCQVNRRSVRSSFNELFGRALKKNRSIHTQMKNSYSAQQNEFFFPLIPILYGA